MKRITASNKTQPGINYIVDIYDRDYNDSVIELDMADTPSRVYHGRGNELYQTHHTSRVRVTLDIVEGTSGETFVQDLIANEDENRFYMILTRANVVEFRGYLLTDSYTIPIRSQDNYAFTLESSDRLGLMSNYDYIDPATPETPYNGPDSIVDHLVKLIKCIGMDSLFATGEPMIAVSTAYKSTGHPNNIDDYARRICIDHRHFASEVEEQFVTISFPFILGGDIKLSFGEKPTAPGNAADALNQLCFLHQAAMYMDKGIFFFVSRARLIVGAAFHAWRYDKSGAFVSSGTVGGAASIGSLIVNNTGHFQFGGNYNFLPAIKEVVVDHYKGGGNNKIQGASWQTGAHESRCFDDINDAGNARLVMRFVFNVTIRHLVGTDKGLFRIVFGIKIKVGNYYLRRDLSVPASEDDKGNLPKTFLAHAYEAATWTTTDSYYKIIIDVNADAVHLFNSPNRTFILDAESPALPVSGVLCVDIEHLETWKYDSFRFLGDDMWDPVTFSNESDFSRHGKTWQIFWSVKDSYINVATDEGELNEDTLAYTRFIASVNAQNSQRISYETRIGDDHQSNTHGRIQIDQSNGFDKSALVDAEGGWQLFGSGAAYANINMLIAWDIARLRKKVTRVMNCELKSKTTAFTPLVGVNYDGRRYIMIEGRSTQTESVRGTWAQVDHSDATDIEVKEQKFSKSRASSPSSVVTVPPVTGAAGPIVYSFRGLGDTNSAILAVPSSTPLPDPDRYDETYINQLFRKALRGSANMVYRRSKTNDTHFSIDVINNNIELYRAPRTADDYLFVWEYPI